LYNNSIFEVTTERLTQGKIIDGAQDPPHKVFISYSHQDKAWLKRLQVHLKPLEREGRVERWDDTRIKPGAQWHETIANALAETKVAVLSINADFLASDFIDTVELPALLSTAEADGAVILPVIVGHSRFARTPSLAQFQAVNSPAEPQRFRALIKNN
jgi:hypothetical protein